MNDLLLHESTRAQLNQFAVQPSHVVALLAPTGAGKRTIALHLAARLLNNTLEKLQNYPYFRIYTPEKSTISIEAVRDITSFTKLKTTGKNPIRRVVVIENAEAMTVEAQNALLKTLEEPPEDTVFILTVTDISCLLSTVQSRLQTVSVLQTDQTKTINYFLTKGYDQNSVQQYYFMSSGLPGLMHALLSENQDHPLVQSIQKAKTILKSDCFERLVAIEEIVKNKQAEAIVSAICTISRSAMYIEAERENSKEAVIKRWAKILQAAEEAKQLLTQNTQSKLVLTSLFLHI